MPSADTHSVKDYICQHCNRTWQRKPTKGQQPKYCPDCRGGPHGKPLRTGPCQVCGVLTTNRTKRQRLTCSRRCNTTLSVGRGAYPAKPLVKQQKPTIFVGGSCARCGEAFMVHTTKLDLMVRYCSKRCKARAHAHHRDVIKRASTDISGKPVFIIPKDAVCAICIKPCDESDYITVVGSDGRPVKRIGPCYPTIDHIIPLALGGTHTRGNLQVACFRCNTRKGASMMGALEWVGVPVET